MNEEQQQQAVWCRKAGWREPRVVFPVATTTRAAFFERHTVLPTRLTVSSFYHLLPFPILSRRNKTPQLNLVFSKYINYQIHKTVSVWGLYEKVESLFSGKILQITLVTCNVAYRSNHPCINSAASLLMQLID